MSTSIERQMWIEDAVVKLRKWFDARDYEVPEKLRVSIGWPKGQHGCGTAIGQCWDNIISSDKHFEVFVSPGLKDGATIIGTLAHELVHATVGIKAGHKGAFKRCATDIGLEGKMTETKMGDGLALAAGEWIEALGDYPAGSLNPNKMKKQSTRLMKVECSDCGYVARVTRKWIEDVGAPYCGVRSHGRMG